MKSKILLACTLGLFLFVACNNNSKPQDGGNDGATANGGVEELKKKVEALHDEVMPKMGDVMKAKRDLEAKAAALKDDAVEQAEEYKKMADELEQAHADMMTWMRDYGKGLNEEVENKLVDFLENKQTQMKDISRKVDDALDDAKAAIDQDEPDAAQ